MIAAGDINLETTVTPLFLGGFEGVGVLPELDHLGGIRDRQPQAFAKPHLFTRREIAGDHDLASFPAKRGVLETGKEIEIEFAETGGEFGFRRVAVFVETLPNGIAVTAESIEGHSDVRTVALAMENQVPVTAKLGDEACLIGNEGILNFTRLDQVDDAEQHQRLVGRDAACLGACGVEVGEFAEPVIAGRLQVFRGEVESAIRSSCAGISAFGQSLLHGC